MKVIKSINNQTHLKNNTTLRLSEFFFDNENDDFNDNYDDNFGNFDDNYDKNY